MTEEKKGGGGGGGWVEAAIPKCLEIAGDFSD